VEFYYNYTSSDLEHYAYRRRSVFYYFENTNQLEKEETFNNSQINEPDWNLVNVDTYFYNEKNKLDSITGRLFREEESYPYPIENYVYDESGQLLLKKEYQNNFIRESAVISREEVIFYYDDFNQLTNLHSPERLANFSIYPNPATDYLYIKIPKPYINQAELTLFSATGVLIRKEHLTKNHQAMPIKDLAKGVYFAHLTNEKGYSIQKIIIN